MNGTRFSVGLGDIFQIECYGPDMVLKWADYVKNLVVDEGLTDCLHQYFKGSNYTAAHYCGLTDGTPTFAATDTMASHPGWNEVTAYAEGARPQVVWGTVTGGSVDNSANKVTYSINNNVTIGGIFLCTDPTLGGVTGILYGGGAFTNGDKVLSSGDTLNVTITASASAV